jgi:hypothetical protein
MTVLVSCSEARKSLKLMAGNASGLAEARMRWRLHWLLLLLAVMPVWAAPPVSASRAGAQASWQQALRRELPLLGHRNWILIVDSAYPLQTSPGVQTLETGAGELEVVKYVLRQIANSPHVSPVVYMDAELPFLTERDAPGVTAYRRQIKAALGDLHVASLPHEQLIEKVDETGKTFNIMVLKTTLTIPYSSVFLQLGCKYWTDEDEVRLRNEMKQTPVRR